MRRAAAASLFALLSCSVVGPSAVSAQDGPLGLVTRAIIAGEPSDDLPAVVALLSKDRRLGCSGVFVRPHVVLTAAHCVHRGDAEPSSVFLGSDLSVPSTALPVVERLIHPEFTPDTFYADIALLGVASAPDLSPASLVGDLAEAELLGADLDVFGYGCTDLSDETEGVGLRRVVPDQVSEVTADHKLRHGGSTCRGDSGGPLVGKTGASEGLVVGISSSGGEKDGRAFSLSTSVPAFRAWADAQADTLETKLSPPAAGGSGGCAIQPAPHVGVLGPLCLVFTLVCRRRRARVCLPEDSAVAAPTRGLRCANPRYR